MQDQTTQFSAVA